MKYTLEQTTEIKYTLLEKSEVNSTLMQRTETDDRTEEEEDRSELKTSVKIVTGEVW